MVMIRRKHFNNFCNDNQSDLSYNSVIAINMHIVDIKKEDILLFKQEILKNIYIKSKYMLSIVISFIVLNFWQNNI